VDLAGSETGTAYIYLDDSGTIIVGHNITDANVTCTGCTKQASVTSFSAASILGYQWPITVGSWDVEQATFDKRSFLSSKKVAGGTGVSVSESSGHATVAVDTAVVSTFASGTSTPPATCNVGDKYLRSDTNQAYQCTSTNTWTETTGGGGAATTTWEKEIVFGTAYSSAQIGQGGGVWAPNSGHPTEYKEGMPPWAWGGFTFSATADQTINVKTRLPSNWDSTSNIDVSLIWREGNGIGTVMLNLGVVCIGDGDAVYNATGPTFSNETDQTPNIASSDLGERHTETFSSVTKAGCAAGEDFIMQIQRLGSDAGDTYSTPMYMISVVVKTTVTL
jgi:hypothetical protein